MIKIQILIRIKVGRGRAQRTQHLNVKKPLKNVWVEIYKYLSEPQRIKIKILHTCFPSKFTFFTKQSHQGIHELDGFHFVQIKSAVISQTCHRKNKAKNPSLERCPVAPINCSKC